MSSVFNKFKSFLGVDKEAPEVFESIKIYAPFSGVVVDQKKIPDEGFSEGYMGVGIGLKPLEDGLVIVPLSGTLEVLFKTQHAYVIREDKTQVAVMLHLGINTVNIPLEKKAFETTLTQGQKVQEKETLCNMNLEIIRKEATSDVSALLVQNENMENKSVEIHKKDGEKVERGDLIMSVIKT
ncbi:PTS sugar transporter subunit IIA [Candidatus Mycoplasma haematominutum]|uniref:Phosphotransferase system glucose-specific IIA component n=1 Tax=Candidatus Mycoplasma haematominutum 'Birmingham 1' TaxID=1116213 RepID=G8C2H8_9MOLU|nr:PTS glucose transporter subunit IIA [Candidatus Mycoplasma haematominutum]CCE66526.1 phosphotransferase system glucose-specific IIA component [Candidatus Mycoplasma haematominutum 'Birmingham 1']